MIYKPSKLGHTGLVFGLWLELISRSVHAGLQSQQSQRTVIASKNDVTSQAQQQRHEVVTRSLCNTPWCFDGFVVENQMTRTKSKSKIQNQTLMRAQQTEYSLSMAKVCSTCRRVMHHYQKMAVFDHSSVKVGVITALVRTFSVCCRYDSSAGATAVTAAW